MILLTLILLIEACFLTKLFLGMSKMLYSVFINSPLYTKINYSLNDYSFMTNLSMGVFISSLVAIIVTSGVVMFIYMAMAIFAFFAMIDYNYKK